MTRSYVDIITFFNSEKDRNIEFLGKVYDDNAKLYSAVKQLLFSNLKPLDFKDKRVLLKPNLVKQNDNPWDEICLFTHPNLILAILTVILECSPKSIIVGDAPIQDCHWEKMLHQGFYDDVLELSKHYNVPISIRDFRKVIFDSSTNEFGKSKRTDEDYLIFDVGDKSWLEPITDENIKFRVTNYDPARMKLSHAQGMHRYCVAKEIFQSDIVITMPKTKTHRMACLTNSLKILVGMNGDKDYLPHHRIGSKSQGGDCYKSFSIYRTCSEWLLDFSNRHRGEFIYRVARKLSSILWSLSKPNDEVSVNAGWFGNDTVWRMVMDLNYIAHYGKPDGTLADIPQRVMYTLCDGIVGGQGSGPLQPDPLALGILSFSNDPYLMDEVMGYIFSLELEKVPLLNEAKRLNAPKEKEYWLNGNQVSLDDIKALKTDVILAPGWVNYNKQ